MHKTVGNNQQHQASQQKKNGQIHTQKIVENNYPSSAIAPNADRKYLHFCRCLASLSTGKQLLP